MEPSSAFLATCPPGEYIAFAKDAIEVPRAHLPELRRLSSQLDLLVARSGNADLAIFRLSAIPPEVCEGYWEACDSIIRTVRELPCRLVHGVPIYWAMAYFEIWKYCRPLADMAAGAFTRFARISSELFSACPLSRTASLPECSALAMAVRGRGTLPEVLSILAFAPEFCSELRPSGVMGYWPSLLAEICATPGFGLIALAQGARPPSGGLRGADLLAATMPHGGVQNGGGGNQARQEIALELFAELLRRGADPNMPTGEYHAEYCGVLAKFIEPRLWDNYPFFAENGLKLLLSCASLRLTLIPVRLLSCPLEPGLPVDADAYAQEQGLPELAGVLAWEQTVRRRWTFLRAAWISAVLRAPPRPVATEGYVPAPPARA